MTARQIRFAGAIARCGSLADARREEPFSDSWIWVLMRDERFREHLLFIGVDRETIEACVRESEAMMRMGRGASARVSGASAGGDGAQVRGSGAEEANSGAEMRGSGAGATNSGAEVRESGVNAADSSTEARGSGAGVIDSGAGERESGAKAAGLNAELHVSGAEVKNSGAEAHGSGANVIESGADMRGSGVNATDSETKKREGGAKAANSGTKGCKSGVDAVGKDANVRGSGAGVIDSGTETLESGAGVIDLGTKVRESGVSAANSGAVMRKSGAETHGSGANMAGSGAKVRGSGVNAADSGAEVRGSGVNAADSGAKVRGSGVNAADSGAKVRGSGVNAADSDAKVRVSGADVKNLGQEVYKSGADMADSGAKVRGSGVSTADSDAKVRVSGANTADSDVKVHESGANMPDSGAKVHGSGAKAVDSGAEMRGGGVEVKNIEIKVRGSGGDVKDSGTNVRESGGGERELLSEIRGLRAAAMRDTSLRLSDRLGAASALEKSLLEGAPAAEEERVRFRLPADAIGRAFVDINRRIVPNVSYIFTGGRCSGKSSFIALKIIEIMLGEPTIHACAVRKLATTLRDSVYAQFEWAIRELGLSDKFRFKYSPLEIVYIPTGQTIFFRGVDDAAKLKSTRPPFGTIGILWREEADQLSGPDEARGIAQSVLRGGGVSYDFSSYNPPRSKKHWINTLPDGGAVRHHSTYLELPEEWVGRKFIDDAEHLREVDPAAYEHEYLGVPNGVGGAVFEKLEVRRITDEETAAFDRIYQGIDFGWYPDPFAFLRLHYDAARERIYLIDELYGNKIQNSEAADFIISRGYDDERIVCDSAEPRSIAELRRFGVPAVGAVKGAGSVAFGFRWLAARTIVVDPERTPKAYAELAAYELTPEGDFPDRDDHAVSALRYATERIRV